MPLMMVNSSRHTDWNQMLKFLQDTDCLNVERILLLKGKQAGLNDNEIFILLLIYTFDHLHKNMITPSLLRKYSSLSNKELDLILDHLLKKKWILNHSGTIGLNKFIDRLLSDDPVVVEDTSMIEIFEEQFDRVLTPMELEIIKEWIDRGLSEDMILKALKEAVKSQVLTLRYIDGILNNWQRNGVKERYIEEKPKERKVAESHYQWWEDE